MVTELRKTVCRRCVEPYDHRGKKLIVSMENGDVLSFREERSRKRFSAPLARVFRQVVVWNVDALKAEKRKKRRRFT